MRHYEWTVDEGSSARVADWYGLPIECVETLSRRSPASYQSLLAGWVENHTLAERHIRRCYLFYVQQRREKREKRWRRRAWRMSLEMIGLVFGCWLIVCGALLALGGR